MAFYRKNIGGLQQAVRIAAGIAVVVAALGASRQTVKARLHRARALMREYLTR